MGATLAAQQTWCLLSGAPFVSDPMELSIARETVQEAASPTSQLVKSQKGAGLHHFNGRLSSAHPGIQKHCREGKGRPSHSQPVPGVLSAKLPHSSLGQSYIPSTPLSTSVCDGSQMLRTGLLSPQGPPNQETQASSSGSYFSSCRHSRPLLCCC